MLITPFRPSCGLRKPNADPLVSTNVIIIIIIIIISGVSIVSSLLAAWRLLAVLVVAFSQPNTSQVNATFLWATMTNPSLAPCFYRKHVTRQNQIAVWYLAGHFSDMHDQVPTWSSCICVCVSGMHCKGHSLYSVTASGCPLTCTSPSPPTECKTTPSEGCVCNPGYLQSEVSLHTWHLIYIYIYIHT